MCRARSIRQLLGRWMRSSPWASCPGEQSVSCSGSGCIQVRSSANSSEAGCTAFFSQMQPQFVLHKRPAEFVTVLCLSASPMS